jgi:hypothetical protein
LSDAIAAPSTDARKKSSWYRIRVTRSARSAGLRWSRGGTAPTFPHSNLSNVRIEGRQPRRTLLSKIDNRSSQILQGSIERRRAGPLVFVQVGLAKQFRGADGAIFIPPRSAMMQSGRGKSASRSKRLKTGRRKMPLFITYASYSHSGVKGLVNKPEDRSGAVN